MRYVIAALLSVSLTACGTLGGAVSGLGEDLQAAGTWIKPSPKDRK